MNQTSVFLKGESINRSLFLKSPDGILEKLNFSKNNQKQKNLFDN